MTDQQITIALAGLEGYSVAQINGELVVYSPLPGKPAVRGVWLHNHPPTLESMQVAAWLPRYLDDANAVIPLLEKHDWNCFHGTIGYEVEVEVEVASSVKPFGIAPTFCRAAAIAVLKAHGLWREPSDVSQ